MYRYLVVAALAAGFTTSSQANTCDTHWPTPPLCEAPNYLATYPVAIQNPGDCPHGSAIDDYYKNFETTCVAAGTPPPNDQLHCVYTGNGTYTCEAWPQGAELTYSWSGFNLAVQSAEAANPVVNLTCTGKRFWAHTVTFRITGPNGEKSGGTAELTCP